APRPLASTLFPYTTLFRSWPIAKSHHISLRLGWRKSRGAQVAVVETPEGPIQLVNWHLGLRESERLWQVDHLLRHHLFRESAHRSEEHTSELQSRFDLVCR